MSVYSTYSIDFQGLSHGKHHFEFDIDDSLFSLWEESEIKRGKGRAAITLNRHSTMLEVETRIAAEVAISCDRCLEDFMLPVNFAGELIVKLTDQPVDEESDGEVMWLHSQADRLPLAQYIYESIILSLPYQRVHPDIKDCNPEMLKRFRIVSRNEFEQIEQELGAHSIEEELGEEEPQELTRLKEMKERLEKEKEQPAAKSRKK